MLQKDKPEDFVIAAAKELSMKIRWEGQGEEEKGYDTHGKCIVAVDPRYFRPTEVKTLLGEPTKAKKTRLDSQRTTFDELVKHHGSKAMGCHE